MLNIKNKKTTILSLLIASFFSINTNYAFSSDEKSTNFASMKTISTYQISNINFFFKEKNKGIIEISSQNLNISNLKINKINDYFLIEMEDTFLPADLIRTMVVNEFDTTIENIESYIFKNKAFLKIKTKENSDINMYSEENKILLTVTKMYDKNKKITTNSYGTPISLEFKDIDVRELLRVLAKYTDLNIIASDSVTGNITIAFNNVNFEHALEVILQSKGLEKRIMNNIIYIAPANEITKMEEDRLTAKSKIDNLSILESKFFQIKYAKAKDLEQIVSAMITERGKIMVDERTNNLIVKDTNNSLKTIESTIEKLDIPITQVLIEARIVIAKKSKSQELGIKWGGTFFDGKNYVGSDYSDVINHYTSDAYKEKGEVQVSKTPIVGFGATNPSAASIAIGISTSTALLDMELSAIEENGDGEVISRPKIVTADKKTASIKSGTQIPYQENSGGGSGATTTAFKDAVMLLEATPQITPDGRIIMDLKITQDSIGELTTNGPSIDTTKIETQVLVNNGETIVLGGIFKSEKISDVSKVPLLGDIPLLGKLFRNNIETDSKSELLIFITPKLIESEEFKTK